MINLEQIDAYRWRIPAGEGRRVPAVVYADQALLAGMQKDATLEQLQAVAGLPGILAPALALPDAHQGYGMPIGGVAALDPEEGIIPPGGVGYDINCGVRLLACRLAARELSPAQLARAADSLAARVPAGVGRGGGVELKGREMTRALTEGAAWAVGRGFGDAADLARTEANGCLPGADPAALSERALKRGSLQVGTLGAGNHFVELAEVAEVFDPPAARGFGLNPGGLVLWIHSGSRGLGHQVCDDYLRELPRSGQARGGAAGGDRQLVGAPPASPVGRAYLAAMAAAANFAFANRQVLAHLAGEALQAGLGLGPAGLGLRLIYDLAHNIAKLEEHATEGGTRRVWVLRKGATRALGPGQAELPAEYRPVGQPILIPGDLGRGSYVLKGTPRAEAETFASSAHGAGRRLSRTSALKAAKGRRLCEELAARGVLVRARSQGSLAEEMPEAYKDAGQVVGVLHGAGLATLVARTRPLVVVKG